MLTDYAATSRRAIVPRCARSGLSKRQLPDTSPDPARGGLPPRVARPPRLWASFPFYLWGYVMPKAIARRRSTGPVAWDRDTSLREAARR